MACLVYIGLKVRRLELACIGWLVVGAIVGGSTHHRLVFATESDYSYLFVYGMMIYVISSGRAVKLTYLTLAIALVAGLFAVRHNSLQTVTITFGVETASLGLVWLCANGKAELLAVKPLLFFGEISYSLYLIHQLLRSWIIWNLVSVQDHVECIHSA